LYPGDPNFMAIGKKGSRVSAWACMECDDIQTLTWDAQRKRYRLRAE
jgi:hypothetical protein